MVRFPTLLCHHRALLGTAVGTEPFTDLDQADDLVRLGSAQLNLMSLHLKFVWQLPIVEHKIDRHGGRSWKRQRPLDQPQDDDDDDDDNTMR